MTARKVARAIGATIPTGASNRCSYKGNPVVIKCAAATNNQVGVLYHMLPELKLVLGAFERDDGRYDVWSIDPSVYVKHERPTRSKGRSAGRVGKVRRSVFESHGKLIDTVKLS